MQRKIQKKFQIKRKMCRYLIQNNRISLINDNGAMNIHTERKKEICKSIQKT